MHITAIYAALLGFLLIFLSARVIAGRRAGGISLGTGGDPLFERRVRAQGNFAEYAPFGLMLLLVLETGGAEAWVLHGLGALLLVGRLLHAYVLAMTAEDGIGRVAGMILTLAMLGISAAMSLRLSLMA